MRVQKQVRPEVSAAPSISTPFLPPSLNALATTFSERPAASAASRLGNSCDVKRGGRERRSGAKTGERWIGRGQRLFFLRGRRVVPRASANARTSDDRRKRHERVLFRIIRRTRAPLGRGVNTGRDAPWWAGGRRGRRSWSRLRRTSWRRCVGVAALRVTSCERDRERRSGNQAAAKRRCASRHHLQVMAKLAKKRTPFQTCASLPSPHFLSPSPTPR